MSINSARFQDIEPGIMPNYIKNAFISDQSIALRQTLDLYQNRIGWLSRRFPTDHWRLYTVNETVVRATDPTWW